MCVIFASCSCKAFLFADDPRCLSFDGSQFPEKNHQLLTESLAEVKRATALVNAMQA
eukprot:COSAG06_NODE_2820_length_6233_cov_12.699463_1_plen_56_part_10